MRFRLSILAAMFAFQAAQAAPALPAAGDAPPAAVTLVDAVRITLERSREIQMAADDVAAAREGKVKADAALLPRVDAAAEFTAFSKPPSAFINRLEVQISDRSILRTRLTAEQTLFDFGRTGARRRGAGARLEAAEEGASAVRQRQALGAIGAFLAARRAEELRKVAAESVETVRAHLKVTRDQYDLGVVAKNDVLAAEVTVANAEAALIAAENQVEFARSRLALRMGYPGDMSVAPAEGDFPVPERASPSSESVQVALSKREEVRAQEAALREAEAALESARAAFGPTFLAQGGHSYETNEFNPHKSVFSFVVGGRLNLFSGFADEAAVREARVSLDRRRQALAQLRDSVALEVKSASLAVAEAQKRLEVARVAVARAEENLRIQNDRYAEGLSINTEVLDAQALLTRARADEKNAAYDLYEARFGLLFARGELMEYLAPLLGTEGKEAGGTGAAKAQAQAVPAPALLR